MDDFDQIESTLVSLERYFENLALYGGRKHIRSPMELEIVKSLEAVKRIRETK